MIVCCVALFRVLLFTQQTYLILLSFSRRRRTALHIFNERYNYHINFSSLLTAFGNSDYYRNLRKARAALWWLPLTGEVGRGPSSLLFPPPFQNLIKRSASYFFQCQSCHRCFFFSNSSTIHCF